MLDFTSLHVYIYIHQLLYNHRYIHHSILYCCLLHIFHHLLQYVYLRFVYTYTFVYLYSPAFIQSQLYSSFHIVSLSSSYFTLSFVMCALLNFCNDMFILRILNQIFFLSSLFSHSLQISHYKLLNHTTLYKVVF